ncbi:hypothetical protein [Oxalicibacterium flavum]|uniref:hypothetical protein n=1 Tax=Oxalicibacterium flavum TaxID=179467 RepID=UPI00166CD909|nr:hypothetical protein [Oxalicibacterium flavum]
MNMVISGTERRSDTPLFHFVARTNPDKFADGPMYTINSHYRFMASGRQEMNVNKNNHL